MKCDLDTPWLVWRKAKDDTRTAYWVSRVPDYPLKTQRLWHGAEPSDDEMAVIAADCRRLYAEARAWAAGTKGAKPQFDGTLGSLIRLYQSDPDSPYREIKYTTQQTYNGWLTLLNRAGAHRRLDKLNGQDFRELYRTLKRPKVAGGPERVRRASSAIQMLRTLLSYGKSLGLPHCERLRSILEDMRFKDIAPRKPHMEFAYVIAFILKAHEIGRPELALGQALQFELTLRQRDVIGEWIPDGLGGERWANGLLWNHIDRDFILTKQTVKTGAEVVFDLKGYPLVMAEIEKVPPERRIGPMIINPTTGLPYKRLAYGRRWREIADAAQIPRDVWNMDSRAGGITEGSDAGADIEHLRHHAAHSNTTVTARYNRLTLQKTREVARLRVEYRKNQK